MAKKKFTANPDLYTYIEERIEERVNTFGAHELKFVCADGYTITRQAPTDIVWRNYKAGMKHDFIVSIIDTADHPIRQPLKIAVNGKNLLTKPQT